MTRRRRAASLLKLRGGGALAATIGLFVLCGPPVGAFAGASVVGLLIPNSLGDMSEKPLALALLAYVLGCLPALFTGVVAALAPFGRWRTYLPACAAAGFVFAAAELILLLVIGHSGTAELWPVIGAMALVGGMGAVAGAACGALVRRLFAKAAQPKSLAQVFT